LAGLANRVARAGPVALAGLVRQQAVALVRQLAAVLVSQVEVVEKEPQTRSVDISRREVVAAAPSLEGVGALLKPLAAAGAVA